MSDRTEARATATAMLLNLGAELEGAGVLPGRMFNGQGLRVEGGFFAFVSSGGRLVVKLTRERCQELIAERAAEPVIMGTRTMREWVSLPLPGDGDETAWRAVIAEGLALR